MKKYIVVGITEYNNKRMVDDKDGLSRSINIEYIWDTDNEHDAEVVARNEMNDDYNYLNVMVVEKKFLIGLPINR